MSIGSQLSSETNNIYLELQQLQIRVRDDMGGGSGMGLMCYSGGQKGCESCTAIDQHNTRKWCILSAKMTNWPWTSVSLDRKY